MLQKLQDNQLNPVLKMLKQALDNVEVPYIEQEYSRVRAGFQNPENSFTSELYYQIRCLQIRDANFNRLFLNTDLNKQMYGFEINSSSCLNNFYRKTIRPDLILHGGQNDLKNQKLVCEIKTIKNLKFDKLSIDLQKLVYYKTSRLKFENAVFIYTDELSKIESLLKDISFQAPNSMLDCLHTNCILFAVPKKKGDKTYNWGIYAIDLGNGINMNCFVK
jgi:hypothetical protein